MKMTVKQTLEQFLLAWNSNAYLNMCTSEDMKNAIECMKECEQYRALGTVEELKEAREKQLKTDWIPCEERLPSEAGCYLVTTDGRYNDIVDIAFYNAEDEVWYKASKILAWQPLPQPYKKEGAENG